jgi:hypothetical protein
MQSYLPITTIVHFTPILSQNLENTGSWVGIPFGAWMYVSFFCVVLSSVNLGLAAD